MGVAGKTASYFKLEAMTWDTWGISCLLHSQKMRPQSLQHSHSHQPGPRIQTPKVNDDECYC